jgi:hypothetical protein
MFLLGWKPQDLLPLPLPHLLRLYVRAGQWFEAHPRR